MTPPRVIVVRTGTANLASMLAGLRRTGAAPAVSEEIADVQAAKWLVLPGVGAFGPAMQRLVDLNLVAALTQRLRAGKPTLAVCLGLQLLAESSAESPGVAGLGVLPAHVTRFPNTVRVPQLGWNEVHADPAAVLHKPGYAYFANSYRLVEPPTGWTAAFADHGGRFIAGLERGALLACQFHPELSGQWGLDLLRRWLQRGTEERLPC
jgi:imidazole glycerol-phosphate synthase subunit HisH